VTAAFGISSGLIEQTHNHLTAYPDTKLIITDTLESNTGAAVLDFANVTTNGRTPTI